MKKVKCCDKLTGRVLKVYGDYVEAAKAAGVPPCEMRKRLGNERVNSRDWLAWRWADEEGRIKFGCRSKPVIAYDGETYAAFLSVPEACIALNQKRGTMIVRVKTHEPFEFEGREVRICNLTESNPAYMSIRKYRREKDCFDERA